MINKQLKKIPYGISDYKTIVDENYLFVDKTRHIELLENLGEPFIFFLRPRLFGKSLFTSILEYYYDVGSKNDFESLFKDTYIGKNPTKKRSTYYVLKFNFSGINTSTKEKLLEGFTNKILNGLGNFTKKYKIKVQYNKKAMPSDIFDAFLTNIVDQINEPIYVLIDEYDHFANELLSFQTDVFEETISKTGFVRKWYEVLKIGTDHGLIQRIFATGVSPITLDSMTSGFNISKNKTRDFRFNECLGFNEEEVKKILAESLGNNIDIGKELPTLKKYYNGYLFNEDAKSRIFNSDMILYYASEYSATNAPPKQLIDTNVSSDYKKISNLFSLGNKKQNLEVLKEILEGVPQNTLITAEFSLAKDFSKDDFNSLLFYLGFLTIESSELNYVNLVVPNYVIKELYFDFFGEIIREEAQYNIDISDIRNSIAKIAKAADISDFLGIVTTTLNKLSYRDFMKFDEKYVKIIMITYFMMSKIYYVKSEYEVEDGYIDIAILPRPGVNAPYNAIFEVKYIKKEAYSESVKAEKIKEAKEQMAKYSTSTELAEMDNLLKWVIVFCGDEVVHLERV
jgi:hypothetical protein